MKLYLDAGALLLLAGDAHAGRKAALGAALGAALRGGGQVYTSVVSLRQVQERFVEWDAAGPLREFWHDLGGLVHEVWPLRGEDLARALDLHESLRGTRAGHRGTPTVSLDQALDLSLCLHYGVEWLVGIDLASGSPVEIPTQVFGIKAFEF